MFRVHRQRVTPRAARHLLGIPFLVGALGVWGGSALMAAELPPAPGSGPEAPTSGQAPEKEKAGAADLIDSVPPQIGLREHGLPTPLGTETAPAVVPTSAPPPAPAPGPAAVPPARQLVLDRHHRVLRVMENGREVRRYPVAVGMPGWETPVGTFSVIEMKADPTWQHPASGDVLPPGPTNPLGSRWIGFYRDCRGRSGFNGQEHLVVKGCVTAGFHGTPNRSSVGRAVSHGCVRLFDEHAKELFDLVSLGTPVTVLP